jgi:hypothetical protein
LATRGVVNFYSAGVVNGGRRIGSRKIYDHFLPSDYFILYSIKKSFSPSINAGVKKYLLTGEISLGENS